MPLRCQKGFSLIEVLIASVIVSIIMASLTLSLQVGLKAHSRNESYLMETRDQEILMMQLTSELRNSVPYSPVPFKGSENKLSFPTRLRAYTKAGFADGLYEVEYRFASGRLIRSEIALKRESIKQSSLPSEEVIFDDLKESKFEYLFVTESGAMTWQGAWDSFGQSEMPRGIRLKMAGHSLGESVFSRDILIPQGVLRQANP